MAINIALVTHDKINLQNSLDMATLYGAQRQAEVLDVISHINFQMRQNYKLLAWRYRILGTVGHESMPGGFYCPPDKLNPSHNRCVSGSARGQLLQPTYSNPRFYDQYFICISVSAWGVTGPSTNHCQNNGVRVTRIRLPTVSVIVPLTKIFSKSTQALINNFQHTCSRNSYANAMIAHLFLTHFRLDQKDRRLMIQKIFEETLMQGKDLDGKFIREGALKTFKKNLTYTNLKNFDESDFTVFNSFQGLNFRNFLDPIPVFPILNFLVTDRTCSGSLLTTLEYNLNNEVSFASSTSPAAQSIFKAFMQLNQNVSTDFSKPMNSLLLGYAPKQINNKKTVYFGISTHIAYSSTVAQLFYPFIGSTNTLTLKATAFSKPFGGKIGPTKNDDPLISNLIRAGEGRAGSNVLGYLYQPNYSLFPGDQLGLIRRSLHTTHYLKKTTGAHPAVSRTGYYEPKHYSYLLPKDAAGNLLPPDALANSISSSSPTGIPLLPARLMELTAIAPDLFDLTYYSILNNYMETYFPRVCKLIGQNGANCNPSRRELIRGVAATFSGTIRGDFGYPYTNIYRENNKNALQTTSSLSPFFFHYRSDQHMRLNQQQAAYYRRFRPPYLLKDPAHTLTSWGPTTKKEIYGHYSFPARTFMKCQQPASKNQTKYLTPSSCAAGGRSGYSVKLISCEHVRSLPNPPPSLNSYCE